GGIVVQSVGANEPALSSLSARSRDGERGRRLPVPARGYRETAGKRPQSRGFGGFSGDPVTAERYAVVGFVARHYPFQLSATSLDHRGRPDVLVVARDEYLRDAVGAGNDYALPEDLSRIATSPISRTNAVAD